ncbi:MAG TPA: ATP-dependent zinc metalloprotease FtsH [Solirubrobacteraceae bacterium]|jgi:cell division protease FtsH|nr:ATP-dependent zinc metalloprotease FtsH [Solirubrobacteraceae bacterium]
MADSATPPPEPRVIEVSADGAHTHKRKSHSPMPRDKRGWQVAPAPDGRGTPPNTQPPAHRTRGFIWFVIALLAVNWLLVLLAEPSGQPRVTVPFSPYFVKAVKGDKVASITTKGDAVQGTFKAKVLYPANSKKATPTTLFATQVPSFWNGSQLEALLQQHGVQINAKSPTSSTSALAEILLGFGPTILLVLLFVFIARRAAGGGGMGALGQFGRSRARRVDPESIRVTFADVAGIDEAKLELTEIVDFLRHPERYGRLGGRMPHGVLLSGAPGTGKTLLARAVAGEAHAAFFSISASEFIEAIVGVGASRVRDLFTQARAAAPSIIFIDELDAIGRSRQGSAAVTGANDEREQTLDQILTEMDGFEPTEATVVLAATNRLDVLDSALLRPGRFDRRVVVQAPDRDGRAAILRVHTQGLPLGPDVDLDALASTTPGMVGADLANLANEAALLAARRGHDTVGMADFTDSLEKIILGAPRGIVLAPADRERTAYHESGHALIGMLTPGADPVRKVSIIPRGMALGVTLSTPDSDRVSYSREELQAKILVALGGRAAEEVVYGTLTTGAESDIQQLTLIARQMVGRWGMSETIGPVAVLPTEGMNVLLPGVSETSAATQQLIDDEVRRIVDEAHHQATELLTTHRDQLESLTRALLAAETLDALDAYAAAALPAHVASTA